MSSPTLQLGGARRTDCVAFEHAGLGFGSSSRSSELSFEKPPAGWQKPKPPQKQTRGEHFPCEQEKLQFGDPVPDKGTCCGLPLALSTTLTRALNFWRYMPWGLKVTVMMQDPPTPTIPPQ